MNLKHVKPGPTEVCKNPAHSRSKKGDNHGAG
jgi:hypothetical protein